MKIIVDAYGGDNAPLSVLQGVQLAVNEFSNVNIVLVGQEAKLRELAEKENISLNKVEFIEAEKVMPVEVDPSRITKDYKDSSMAIALQSVAEGKGDAVVSAGSTGAVVVGSIFFVKRIKGIRRPALGVVMPTTKGYYLLIDNGANAVCRPEMLLQFGIMGSIYMEYMMGVKSPKVGMVNIGSEPNKGLELQIKANELLAKAPINFIGNVEGHQLPIGECDVAVADGFTGNVILKVTEGMGRLMKHEVKELLTASPLTTFSALFLQKGIKKLGKRMDPSEYGGVPLFGVTKPVIKAHGSSDAKAIKNAIRQAKDVVEQNMIKRIEDALLEVKEANSEE